MIREFKEEDAIEVNQILVQLHFVFRCENLDKTYHELKERV